MIIEFIINTLMEWPDLPDLGISPPDLGLETR